MSEVIDYGLAGGGDATGAALQVKQMMAEGWQPYGAPFSHGDAIVQAMVRERRPRKRIRRNSEDD